MTDREKFCVLSENEITEVKEKAAYRLSLCKKNYDVIGTQIFSILCRFARPLYYPLGSKAPWGFVVSAQQKQKPYIVLNSSLPEDSQVFAAAHELYHLWYSDNCKNAELKANRFAAEFLMDCNIMEQELNSRSFDRKKLGVKEVLQLAALFVVPYKAMVKRLGEIQFINDAKLTEFLVLTEPDIERYRKIYALPRSSADNRIAIDNLTELAVKAYEKKLITFEKLEYLLNFSKLTPANIGLRRQEAKPYPSDAELDEV